MEETPKWGCTKLSNCDIHIKNSKRFIGNTKEKTLGKIFLEALSPPEDPLCCYRKYLGASFSMELNFHEVSGFTRDRLSRLYRWQEPLKDAKFFKRFRGNGQDVAKLEDVLNCDIVVLQHWIKNVSNKNEAMPDFVKIYDSRCVHRMLKLDMASGNILLDANKREIKGFVIKTKKDSSFDVFQVSPDYLLAYYSPWKTEERLRASQKSNVVSFTGCYIHDISMLLRNKPAETHVCDENCYSILHLSFSGEPSEISKLICRLAGSPFAIARNGASNLLIKPSNIKGWKGISQWTRIIACFGKPSLDTPVVLLSSHSTLITEGKKRWCQTIPVLGLTCHSLARELMSDYLKKINPVPNSKTKKCSKGKEKEEPKREHDDGTFVCPCTGCEKAHEFQDNFPSFGRRSNFTQDPSIFDLMKMLNLDTVENVAHVRKAAVIGLGSFDLESVHRDFPNNRREISEVLSSSNPVSGFSEERQIRSCQEVIRIGFTDTLFQEQSASPDRSSIIIRRVDDELVGKRGKSNEIVGEDGLVYYHCIEEAFLNLLLERQKIALHKKTEILSPLLEVAHKYKQAHVNFYAKKGIFCGKVSHKEVDFEVDCIDELGSKDEEVDFDMEGNATANPLYRSGDCQFCAMDTNDEEPQTAEALVRRTAKYKRLQDRNKGIMESYRHSVFGKFEASLKRMIQSYHCLAFNGMYVCMYVCTVCMFMEKFYKLQVLDTI